MRLYVSVLTALGLTISACGKKTEAPKPTTAEVEKPAEKPAEQPAEKPAEKPVEQPAEKPAEKPLEQPAEKPAEAPVDRTAGVQASLEALSSGKIEEAFANFADDATITMVGTEQKATGKEAIIAWQRASLAAFPDAKFKASRIVETGDTQITFFVMQGTNTAEMNGKPATNKSISVAGALVTKYNEAGKVTTVDQYMDSGVVMAQLGLFPGQPADAQVPMAPWPETTEVVKAEAVPANIETLKAFSAKMKLDTIEAAVNESFADDFTSIDVNGAAPSTGKEPAIAMFKGMLTTMGDYATTVDEAWSAGEWVFAKMTDTFVYKGGIPGVEAKDQKVTMHSLGVAQIVDGKFKTWSSYMNQLEVLGQLGVLGGAAEKPAEDGAAGEAAPADGAAAELPKFGIEVCDKYLAGIQACIGAMPEAARSAVQDGLKQTLDAWKQVAAGGDEAKAALEQGCKSALDASKQSMGAVCPDVKWE